MSLVCLFLVIINVVIKSNSPLYFSRYKALEAMLEETMKRSVEVREEKIASLESRLSESVSRNQELRNNMMQVINYEFISSLE